MKKGFSAFRKMVLNPGKFRMFLLAKIPSAFFSGVRVRNIAETSCAVSVPYKWFSQNPFRSTYFACLGMAAEMSTGALGMAYVYKHDPPVSMLIVKLEAEYFKKAVGLTIFTCEDGLLIRKAIEETVATGESRIVTAKSIGKNEKGELIAEFRVSWSFKVKQHR